MIKKIFVFLLLFISSAIADVIPITVKVDDYVNASGTGTIISDGFIVTNYHVVANGVSNITVGPDADRPAKVLAIDEASDLAILEADTSGYEPYKLKVLKSGVGKVLGFMDGQLHYSVSSYHLNELGDIEFKGSVYNGQSGGALVDVDTNFLAGIVSAIYIEPGTCMPNGGKIIPISKVFELIDRTYSNRTAQVSFFH